MDRKAEETISPIETERAIDRALSFLESLQNEDGSWQGDYGGTIFLIPMYIITCHVAGEPVSGSDSGKFIAYYRKVQRHDGSIGMHPEDEGRMFTTVLSYVALRILGVNRDDPYLVPMRKWIKDRGGALGASSWGKFYLALMNLYPYEGLNPLQPELFMLPSRLPFHPSKMWCHARMVYLPMAYLYGLRARTPENTLVRELRREIYCEEYESIPFKKHRNTVCPEDDYRPYTPLFKRINIALCAYEKIHSKALRKRALDLVYRHILYEETSTFYYGIGPVNRTLNTLAHYYRDSGSVHFKLGIEGMKKYRFYGNDGLKINGYNSTALWDTAFAVQAIAATGKKEDYRRSLEQAHCFIKKNRITDDLAEAGRYFRQTRKGAWPFSDREQGWPVTDCTAEGYLAQHAIRDMISPEQRIPWADLEQSIDFILKYQNSDGGWATYEKRLGGLWLEKLNPSSVFADIMVDYSHVECTSSCLKLLSLVRNNYRGPKRKKIEKAMTRGARFLLAQQRPDGGFKGCWAVCFSYGTWFAVNGLMDAGFSEGSPQVMRACAFLLDRQREDGGWGESHLSCRDGRWVDHEKSQVVNTAWALMALVRAGLSSSPSVQRAVKFLVKKQRENGDWPEESLVGLFNNTALINYDNYRRYFPLMALALYRRESRHCAYHS
ncbi:MAG TPA: terpene cyclase/mutase family protein [Spirochaetota bacterium]|nr:terpene cyclase/mutase family protein [Spirochaetota bacterium]HPI90354.1 terpene cyclase/mutase family protein [Spirochaetota bacterium]HPR48478.1 terpene cyclase/mutase family protein [Spirochaetota bacterium]